MQIRIQHTQKTQSHGLAENNKNAFLTCKDMRDIEIISIAKSDRLNNRKIQIYVRHLVG